MGGKPWSAEEYELLKSHWGSKSLRYIAKLLGRSENAVKIKVDRLGLGPFLENGEYVTINQLLSAIGMWYGRKNRLIKNGFPIKYKRNNKNRFAVVYIEDFWEWAEQHKELIDFSKIPLNILGKEPVWVKASRTADYNNKAKTSPWTPSEDSQLVDMLKSYRYYIDDIAAALNRTEGAVKRRIHDLGIIYRPLKHQSRPWTDSEVLQLLEMRSSGYSWSAIGKKLGRSGASCSGKFDNLANPYYNKRYTRNSKAALRECFQKEMCSHWHKASGCDVNGNNCDSCEMFCRITGERDTGWNSTKECEAAKKILEEMMNQDSNNKQ